MSFVSFVVLFVLFVLLVLLVCLCFVLFVLCGLAMRRLMTFNVVLCCAVVMLNCELVVGR